jgi:hypothetical protein
MASIDDVHDLLNAVNAVTLKRMEEKTDAINTVTLKRMEEKTEAISNVDLKRIEEKADRAVATTRDFQIQVRAQLGDIDAKLQRIMMALFAPSTAPPPSPPPSGEPTVDELSSVESVRERARRAKQAAEAAAHAVGFTIPPPSRATDAPLTSAELCGAAVCAHDLAMIAVAEGLGGGYAAYYFGLAEAYTTACVAAIEAGT